MSHKKRFYIIFLFKFWLLAGCFPSSEEEELRLEPPESLSMEEVTSEMTSTNDGRDEFEASSRSKLKSCIKLVNRLSVPLKKLQAYLDASKKLDNLAFQLAALTPSHCTGPSYEKTLKLTTEFLNTKPSRIGIILPLSGAHRQLADSVVKGVNAATHNLNADFAKHFVIKDSGGYKDGALRALAKLLFYERVSLVIGGLNDEEAGALAPLARGLVTPMLILNKDRSIIDQHSYAFQVYPNPRDMALDLTHASQKLGYRSLSFLRPASGKADYLCELFKHYLQNVGIKVVNDLTYKMGDYDSMNHAVQAIAHTNIEERKEEYLDLLKKAEEQAKEQGTYFNPRLVVLPPIVNTDALFIPGSYRNVRFFIKLLKYHGIEKLPLIGNHEWRSRELLVPWDDFLNGAIFADYIGSYLKLPPPLKVETYVSEFFVPTYEVAKVDFQLLGFRSATIALQTISTRFLKQKHLVRQLQRLHETGEFFRASPSFYRNRTIRWPTYVFKINQENIQLIDQPRRTGTDLPAIAP